MPRRPGFLVVISGPSGAGKTSIARGVRARLEGLVFSVSATTRPPRPGEAEGVDYAFVTEEQFRARIAAGEFLEWASYAGHLYGTPERAAREHLDAGREVLLEIESAGAAMVKARMPESVMIFVLPPRAADLGRRIQGRSPMTFRDLEVRMTQMAVELVRAQDYDYLVINKDLDEAITQVQSIIVAERCRMARQRPRLEQWAKGAEQVGHPGSIAGQADEPGR